MTIELAAVRQCLDGAVPAAIATCSADGVPNVSYVSEVHYVDTSHVALSYQFFNKTRTNVLATRGARALVIDPQTGGQYSLELRYLRTETTGPLFEAMRAKLAGIAAHTGMADVFRLRGSDLYEVVGITAVDGASCLPHQPAATLLSQVRAISQDLVACGNLDALVDSLLDGLERGLASRHSMLFFADGRTDRLYLIGSRGYEQSGVGSEIPFGHGIVGLAASARTTIRVTHSAEEFRYSDAVRRQVAERNSLADFETAIPLPGLAAPGSQLAIPVIAVDRVLGVLYVESERDGAFNYDSEDALVTIANQFASSLYQLGETRGLPPGPEVAPASHPKGRPLRIRWLPETSSIFIDDEYLIRGVAGAIFWKLVREYAATGRSEFTNRELRADRSIRLPELSENLEARLLLLKRRLQEQQRHIAIVPVARGRFRLDVSRPLRLETADSVD